MSDKYLGYYEKSLTLIDCTAVDGNVVDRENTEQTISLEGKKIVLPTQKNLEKETWKESIAFHPLCENSIADVRSAILNHFYLMSQFYLNLRAYSVMLSVIDSVVKNAKVPPEAMEQISVVCPNLNKKAGDFLTNIIQDLKFEGPEDRLINIGLNRNSEYDGKKYKSVCQVSSLLYDADEIDEGMFLGKKAPSKTAAKSLNNFFNWFLTGTIKTTADDLSQYDTTSNAVAAPSWISLTNSLAKLHARINDIVILFDLESDYKLVETDFINDKESITKLKLMIPALDGNQGTCNEVEEEAPITEQHKPSAFGRSDTVNNEKKTGGAFPRRDKIESFGRNRRSNLDNLGTSGAFPRKKAEMTVSNTWGSVPVEDNRQTSGFGSFGRSARINANNVL